MHNYMELVEDKELVIILMFVLKEIVNSIHVHFWFCDFYLIKRREEGHGSFSSPFNSSEAVRKNFFFLIILLNQNKLKEKHW